MAKSLMNGYVHFSVGGPTLKIFSSNGNKAWYFEMHSYCGPMPINKKTGEGITLGNSSEFWRVVSYWAQQGQRMVDNMNVCKWDKPKIENMKHISGNHYELITK